MVWQTGISLTAAIAAFAAVAALAADGQAAVPQAGARQARTVVWNSPPEKPIPGVEHGVNHSPAMGIDVGYNVWLPAEYATGTKRYPVVYFLHGAGGTESSDAGGFSGLVKTEIDAGKCPPVICVFPNGGMSGYRDDAERKIFGETLIIKELIPLIDSKYRTVASRDGRTICGFSMGGGGAIRLSIQHPDLFSAAASWAAALGSRGASVSTADLVKENAEKIRGKVRYLLIVGDKDMTLPSHAPVLDAFKEAKIPFDEQILPGVDHNLGAYYSQTGAKLVRFVTDGFPRAADTK